MPAFRPSLSHDGRINLEQQRKRAKALLKLINAGAAPEYLARLARPVPVRLADAQWLVARDLGFDSWPALKTHVDALAFAARHPDFAASDEPRTQHWRCGNDIAHSLQLAGFKGRLHMLADPLCMGPVQDLPAAAYQALRSEFISTAFALNPAEIARRTAQEYADLQTLGVDGPAVLWCEADAYDQLFLVRVLAGLECLPPQLELIEVDRVPGVVRFIGIGQLAPDVLAWLWPRRRRVDAAAVQLARQAWAAYCAADPSAWARLAHGQTPELPLLAPALLRQLQELPWLGDGLSLTERLSLQILADFGQVACARVFAELMAKREPLPYLGDMMFYALLRPLIEGPQPLIVESDPHLDWPQRSLALTALGQAVLAGQAYWPDHSGAERWIGGVRIRGGEAHWALGEQMLPVWRE